ncbi:hypothetical protein TorRG33x02_105120 [Trema orientale]|uniref:Uncharacterized protein n=1 Tax=Trema orientale TaxID=63057 RepID=A0A2P5F7S3_TREOI|nr:hypothetical protein TorRG33x02_105120 [Trema orientale]
MIGSRTNRNFPPVHRRSLLVGKTQGENSRKSGKSNQRGTTGKQLALVHNSHVILAEKNQGNNSGNQEDTENNGINLNLNAEDMEVVPDKDMGDAQRVKFDTFQTRHVMDGDVTINQLIEEVVGQSRVTSPKQARKWHRIKKASPSQLKKPKSHVKSPHAASPFRHVINFSSPTKQNSGLARSRIKNKSSPIANSSGLLSKSGSHTKRKLVVDAVEGSFGSSMKKARDCDIDVPVSNVTTLAVPGGQDRQP